MHCNCEKAATENTISGARCSCSKDVPYRLMIRTDPDKTFQTSVPPVPALALALSKRTASPPVKLVLAASVRPVSRIVH